MYRHIRKGLLLLFILSLCAACGKDTAKKSRSGNDDSAADGPTKAALIDTVKKLHDALVAQDADEALKYFLVVKPAKEASVKERMSRGWKEDDENLNTAGIALLEEKAEFGKLSDIFPKSGKRRVERAQIPMDECYALKLKSAEIMAHWKDGKFRIFRMDDAGSKVVRQMKE